jgi:hypothetical protein
MQTRGEALGVRRESGERTVTYYEWLIGWEMRQKARKRQLKEMVAAARLRALGKSDGK